MNAPDMRADLLLLQPDANPFKVINDTRKISRVWIGGLQYANVFSTTSRRWVVTRSLHSPEAGRAIFIPTLEKTFMAPAITFPDAVRLSASTYVLFYVATKKVTARRAILTVTTYTALANHKERMR